MPTYVLLTRFAQQGVENIHDNPARSEEAKYFIESGKRGTISKRGNPQLRSISVLCVKVVVHRSNEEDLLLDRT